MDRSIEITDLTSEEKIQVCSGYGGILFVSHLCISMKDAKALAIYINKIVSEKRRRNRLKK